MEASNSKKKKSFSIIKEINAQHKENLNSKQFKILKDITEKSICEIKCDNGYGTGFFVY